MALERVPADIRAQGGVARMVCCHMHVPILFELVFSDDVRTQSDPKMIKEIVDAVTIPVMAKVRIGHFVEAQVRATARSNVVGKLRSPAYRSCKPLGLIILMSLKF